jgi:hypothetical protein
MVSSPSPIDDSAVRPPGFVATLHIEATDAAEAPGRLRQILAAFAERPGFLDGVVARSVDDPARLLLHLSWVDVGSYRRALSHPTIKMDAIPRLGDVIDQPSAFEVLQVRTPAGEVSLDSALAADAFTVGLGDASAAFVPGAPQ